MLAEILGVIILGIAGGILVGVSPTDVASITYNRWRYWELIRNAEDLSKLEDKEEVKMTQRDLACAFYVAGVIPAEVRIGANKLQGYFSK